MHNILKKLGIDIPKEHDSWMRYLIKNYPNKIFEIDNIPFSVSMENNDKYAQIELIFQEAEKNKQLMKTFVLTENRYINLFTKLWLYNKFYVGAHICTDEDYEMIKKKYHKDYKKLQAKIKQSGLVEVTDKLELDYLVRLGTRDIAEASFYCEEYELLIVSSWGFFLVYFNDLSHFDKVKDIVVSEGLFLRGS